MNRKIFFVFFLFITVLIFNETLDIKNINFEGVNINTSKYKTEKNISNYNIAYSPILPAGGIYSAIDDSTGKEAIIQIGYAKVDESPYTIYMPEHIFNFFSQGYKDKTDKIKVKLKFLAWNKDEEEGIGLNLTDLIVMPDDSLSAINKIGKEKYFIQLGAFSYYQNSYDLINNLFPMMQVTPKFFIIKIEVKTGNETNVIYKILAGPYSMESAQEISQKINSSKKAKVYINSGETILKESEK